MFTPLISITYSHLAHILNRLLLVHTTTLFTTATQTVTLFNIAAMS